MTDETYIDLENRLDFLLPEKRGYLWWRHA
jgi:hypothetical protein